MKDKIIKIAEDLKQGTITETKARTLLLGLLGVSVRSSGTTVRFLLSENSEEQSVHFDGSPSYNYIDIYFESKYGGVHKWWV